MLSIVGDAAAARWDSSYLVAVVIATRIALP